MKRDFVEYAEAIDQVDTGDKRRTDEQLLDQIMWIYFTPWEIFKMSIGHAWGHLVLWPNRAFWQRLRHIVNIIVFLFFAFLAIGLLTGIVSVNVVTR